MTTAEWQNEMRKVLAPHIAAMKRDVQKHWPAIDAELMLLHWFCLKYGVEPPPLLSLARKDDKAEKSRNHDTRDSKDSISSSPPAAGGGTAKTANMTGMTPRGISVATPRQKPDAGSRPMTSDSKPGGGRVVLPDVGGLLPISSTFAPSDTTGLPTENSTMTVSSAWTGFDDDSMMLPKDEGTTLVQGFQLKQLAKCREAVWGDSQRHAARIGKTKDSDANMTRMIAQMRQELRGKFLVRVPLFTQSVLTQEEQFKLVGKLRPWTYEKDHVIIREGDVGNNLYILECGECVVIKNIHGRDEEVAKLKTGAFFGEVAVLYDIPRSATVKTITDVTVLSLSRSDLFSTIGAQEELHKMRVICRVQVLGGIPLIADLSSEQKVRIAEALKSQRWEKGSILAGRGHITSKLVIIESGSVLMEVKDRDHLPSYMSEASTSALLGPGQFFGMQGLIFGAPLGWNVEAVSNEVWTLSISFEELLDTAQSPDERSSMAVIMRDSMQRFLLRQIPQVKRLADNYFESIKSHSSDVTFKPWTVIESKGAPFEYIYILERGKMAEYDGAAGALQDIMGKEVELSERSTPGEYFGVEALTDKHARCNHTLVALTDVTLLRVPLGVIWSVLHEERQHISKIPMMSLEVLSKAEQYRLVGKLRPWNFRAGHVIIKEGELGDRLYILEKGVCDAVKDIDGKELIVAHLKKGSFFGELGVMYDIPRSATVRAATDAVCVSLSRDDLVANIAPENLEKMKIIARTQVFSNIALLSNLPTASKIGVARRFSSSSYSKGQVIVSEDDQVDRLFLIEKGHVDLSWQKKAFGDPGSNRNVRLMSGQYFGMRGLLYQEETYKYTVVAATDEVRVMTVTVEDILATAGTGGRPALERNLRDASRCFLLKQVHCMKDEHEEFFHALLNHIEIVDFEPGQVVFSKHQTYDALYVLEYGRVECQKVSRKDHHHERLASHSARPDSLRSMSTIDGAVSIINVDAKTMNGERFNPHTIHDAVYRANVFGENCLNGKAVAYATIQAVTPCRFLRLLPTSVKLKLAH